MTDSLDVEHRVLAIGEEKIVPGRFRDARMSPERPSRTGMSRGTSPAFVHSFAGVDERSG